MKIRYILEDALKVLHECEYAGNEMSTGELATQLGLNPRQALALQKALRKAGLTTEKDGILRLSEAGRSYARHILRAHRLLETYMAQRTGEDGRSWHKRADKREHHLTTMDIEDMDSLLNHPRFDPHGDPIPSKRGTLPPLNRVALADCECGFAGQIDHLEDEPPEPYARLMQHQLAPGMSLRIEECSADGYWVNVAGRRIFFDSDMCRQVHLCSGFIDLDAEQTRLSEIDQENKAEVIGILPSCRGAERDRLLDLGVVPGTRVRLELEGPHGDPRAYLIRGAIIALRRSQAEKIQVRIINNEHEVGT
jgi:DtxR family Mn-dependent transcriptional regulator